MASPHTSESARAVVLGARLPVRELDGWQVVASAPLTLCGRSGGYFVIFRFGVLVAVGTDPDEADAVIGRLGRDVVDPHPSAADETALLRVAAGKREGVSAEGDIELLELDPGRAQVIASVLAKSAVLGYYEERVADGFDRVEALATHLHQARVPTSGRELLRQIGETLLIRTRMVGRVELGEKPEITWEDPELDRLYRRLAVEYELVERDHALTRKLELISDVAQTYLGLLDTRKTLRVEWYIVILIVVEIVLIVWELLGRG